MSSKVTWESLSEKEQQEFLEMVEQQKINETKLEHKLARILYQNYDGSLIQRQEHLLLVLAKAYPVIVVR